MTDYLSSRAAKELLEIIQHSYFGGLIPWGETASRLEALAMLCEPNAGPNTVARRVLAMNDFAIEGEWPDDSESQRNALFGGEIPEPTRTTVQLVRQDWDDDSDDFVLQLIPAGSTGLSSWIFHQADEDPFPSIPHGHLHGKSQPKLNPYTGWIYNGSQQTSREKRKKIVALWNDSKFRNFAREAIDFYLGKFPKYTGWRVPNPRRLPRKR